MKVTFTAEATPAEVAELVTFALDGLVGVLSGFTMPDTLTTPAAPESGTEEATAPEPQEIDLLDFRAELRRRIEETNSQLRDIFVSGITRVLEQHPEIQRVHWQQYTDYFNDGDACEFHVHDKFINNISDDYNEEWGWRGEFLPEVQAVLDASWQDGSQRALGDALFARPSYAMTKAFLDQFTDDDYRYMFGDHVEITVERDETGNAKVEAKEYKDHD